MDSSREALLRDYLQRVTALREEMDDNMTLQHVQDVARELGMSQSDLAAAAQAAADHRERGVRYSSHGQHDDAVRELRDAVALDPFSTDGLYALADALRLRDERGDKDEALHVARRVVEMNPKHEAAYKLIRAIRGDEEGRPRPRGEMVAAQKKPDARRTAMLWTMLGVGCVVALVLVMLLTTSSVEAPRNAPPVGSESGITVLPDPNATEPAISVRQTPPSNKKTPTPIEFTWDAPHDGFDLTLAESDHVVATEMIVGQTDGFETSHNVTLEAVNRSQKPITSLALRFTDFDGNGKKLGAKQIVAIAPGDLPLPAGEKRTLQLRYPTSAKLQSYKVEVAEIK